LVRRRKNMKFDPKSMSNRDVYSLFMGIVTPRPIAWVSTVDVRGIHNLAPFSTYTLMSSTPAVLGFGVGAYRDGKKKDTIRNIEATKEFVINIVTEELAEAMNVTSAPFPPEVSEFERAGLTPVPSELVIAARVGESPVCMECRMLQILRFGKEPIANSFVIGEVVLVHVNDLFWNLEGLDYARLKTVGRMGGGTDLYCRTTDKFVLKRPSSPV
jgi:flavin reductase (DIM6/NTAB) family NADH-FMN oxidoreductase RutF